MVGSRFRSATACAVLLPGLYCLLIVGCGQSNPPRNAAISADMQGITARYNQTTNLIAVGEWSKPVTDPKGYTLRGRLLVFNPPIWQSTPTPVRGNPPVYVELQNLTRGGAKPVGVYAATDDGFEGRLLDSRGNPPTNNLGMAWDGVESAPMQSWVLIPEGASVRAPLSDDGNMVTASVNWRLESRLIPPGTTYSLDGSFSPPTNHPVPPELHLWRGKLVLPAVKISGDQL